MVHSTTYLPASPPPPAPRWPHPRVLTKMAYAYASIQVSSLLFYLLLVTETPLRI